MRPIKLRPRDPELPPRKLRLQLPGRLGAELEAYRDVYVRTHGLDIDLPALIQGILEQFLATDRGFQRRRTIAPTDGPRARVAVEPDA